MSRTRHVFFRDSSGRPYTHADGRHAPTNLLADLGQASILQEGGTIAWKAWPQWYEPLFSSFVILGKDDKELNDADTKSIAWKALGDVAKKAPGRPLNAAEVLKAADTHARTFFLQPVNKYVLVTSLSVKTFPAERLSVRGSAIRPLRERGERFPLPKVLHSAAHRGHFAQHLKSSQYQLIRIDTEGRSIFEGVGKALDDLNLLRALWSLGATLGRQTMRLSSGPRRPIGVIHTGPVHTLHKADGSAANEDYYWFDPDYRCDLDLFKKDDEWQKIEKDRRWAMRRMGRLAYRTALEELFSRYIAALDQSNLNLAFLQFWGILEKLTDTVGGHYDETIRRACWVYRKEDRPVMKENLEALRHHRNRYVHSGNAGQESEEITYLIKAFVDPHLVRLLNNTFKVQSLREYGEFLSLPTDIKRLEQMRAWSSQALRAAGVDVEEGTAGAS